MDSLPFDVFNIISMRHIAAAAMAVAVMVQREGLSIFSTACRQHVECTKVNYLCFIQSVGEITPKCDLPGGVNALCACGKLPRKTRFIQYNLCTYPTTYDTGSIRSCIKVQEKCNKEEMKFYHLGIK